MEFKLLTQIDSPTQLRQLSESELLILAQELRDFLVDTVSRTGGHLASNLGVIELTIALHYIFNTPEDRLVWDVGHQSYAHKVLTGRREAMSTLRQWGGIAGFPKRSESIYDTFDVGHSSTSIGAALGMAVAAKYQGLQRKVVAIIGDGAMTAGMAFEALNHAGSLDANLLVILNDNDMSISPNVGALSNYLAKLLSSQLYTSVREGSKQLLNRMPTVRELAKRTEEHMKGMVIPGTLFEELGFNYIGPIDGHDLPLLLTTLANMKALEGPQFLHVVTCKGKGFTLAENNPCGYHGVTAFDPKTGKKAASKSANMLTYTQVFGEWLCDMAEQDARLIGITPAMREGSGLVKFSEQFPDRYLDVGIAEQHSLTLAAGLACEGLKPVVAIYSTFLQRAYDQLIHDVALQNLPILLAIDRGGIVGADGPTHAGGFDLTYLRCIPNMIVMTPASENECRQMLTTGFLQNSPSAVRYPRTVGIGEKIEPALTPLPVGKAKLCRSGHKIALLVFGTLLAHALQAAEQLDATVVNMRFVKPLDVDMVLHLAQQHDVLVTIEENVIMGGAGSAVNECLHTHICVTSVLNLGLPDDFTQQGDRNTLLKQYGLDAAGIVRAIVRHFSTLKPESYLTGIVTTAKTK
jgi:1-deoxy-D-xylulose-5-phosphate synthase